MLGNGRNCLGGTEGHMEQTSVRNDIRTGGEAAGKRETGQRNGNGEKAKGGWTWGKKNQEKKEGKKTYKKLSNGEK